MQNLKNIGPKKHFKMEKIKVKLINYFFNLIVILAFLSFVTSGLRNYLLFDEFKSKFPAPILYVFLGFSLSWFFRKRITPTTKLYFSLIALVLALIVGLSGYGFLASVKYILIIIPLLLSFAIDNKKISNSILAVTFIIYIVFAYLYINDIKTHALDANEFIKEPMVWINEGISILFWSILIISIMNVYKKNIQKLINNYENKNLQVRKLAAKTKKALKVQKQAKELKNNMISVTSHEFRNPLAVISLSVGNVIRFWDKLSEEDKLKKLAKVESQVTRMNQLLEHLVFSGKLEAGEIECEFIEVNAQEFLQSVLETVKLSFKKEPTIILKCEDLETNLFIDLELGKRIFQNLLTNAIKYGNEKEVLVHIKNHEKSTIIEVTDHGNGMSQENLSNLFKPFKRGKNVENIQGTGLGLTIVKNCVDRHQGTIEVQSEVGKGSTFKVSLPHKGL